MPAGDEATRPGHVQFGDLLLGPGTPYGWREVSGWEELPALDSGTVTRADAHGAYPGSLLAQPRTITFDGVTIRTEPGAMGAATAVLRRATAVRETELPLVIVLDDAPPLVCWARCLRRVIPVGVGGYANGVVVGAALQFEASDPRRYSLVERRTDTGLPAPEPGLVWTADPPQLLPAAQASGRTPTGQWSVSGTVTLGAVDGAVTIRPTQAGGELDWTREQGARSGWSCAPGDRVRFASDLVELHGATAGVYWWDASEWGYVGEQAGTPGVALDITVPAGVAFVQPWVRVAAASAEPIRIGASTLHVGPRESLDWGLPGTPERGLDWGSAGSTGAVVVTNEGDAPAHPVIVFRGPVSRPSVTNLSTDQTIEYDIDLTRADELLVDTATGAVTLNGTASRLYTATHRSVPEQVFTLEPGTHSLLFRAAPESDDPHAAVALVWRSAYW
ncbi:phage distal tail protein [Embleya sp. MST-111070]|uniref:phage distal tail protein n=1 Tax=Embleya sp. MST-111070 TaxID=3398231 RepID=UPI003F7390B4